MRPIILFLAFTILFCACSTENKFHKRKYTPGIFVNNSDGPGNDTKDHGFTNSIKPQKTIANELYKVTIPEDSSERQLTKAYVNEKSKLKVDSFQNIGSRKPNMIISPLLLAIDTIPPQNHECTPKEIKQTSVLSTVCVAILICSWIMLPVIGWIAFFLIQFCIGTLALFLSDYCHESKYLNVTGIITEISLATLVLVGIFNLIYCTFLRYCGN